jgi:hypothetical protein
MILCDYIDVLFCMYGCRIHSIVWVINVVGMLSMIILLYVPVEKNFVVIPYMFVCVCVEILVGDDIIPKSEDCKEKYVRL